MLDNTYPKNRDQIFVKDLVVVMSAGIYDHEKNNPQRVIFNITLDVESNYGRKVGDIEDVVSYEDIVNDITSLCSAKHYDLLEELAERAADICLSYPRVLICSLTLEKPDIIKNTGSVGIKIMRSV